MVSFALAALQNVGSAVYRPVNRLARRQMLLEELRPARESGFMSHSNGTIRRFNGESLMVPLDGLMVPLDGLMVTV